MALDHGHAVKCARGAGVDVVGTAGGTHVGDVGQVGEGEVADGVGDAIAAVPVVPGAEVAGGGVEGVGVRSGRGHDHDLRVAQRGRARREVRDAGVGLLGDLRGGRVGRRGRCVVIPDTGEHTAARRVADVEGARRAGGAAAGDALAELRHDAGPQLAVGAEALEELLEARRHGARVTGERHVAVGVGAGGAPLAAPEDEVDAGGAGRDADAGVAAVVGQLTAAGGGARVAGDARGALAVTESRVHDLVAVGGGAGRRKRSHGLGCRDRGGDGDEGRDEGGTGNGGDAAGERHGQSPGGGRGMRCTDTTVCEQSRDSLCSAHSPGGPQGGTLRQRVTLR